ncbi:MAG: hypothetical protein HQ558_04815 [Candidatus Omnitrophica bacterium]|nr:hypothetical protein [Candidatus Omnitrophota bacterium]
MKIDLDKMSSTRKIVVTALGLLYAIAILGNIRHGLSEMIGVTVFFAVVTTVIFLWVK